MTREEADNPCAGVRKLRVRGDGFRAWGEDAIALYEARWPVGTRQRLAFDLLLYTGQRRSDVVGMSRAHLRESEDGPEIRVIQSKTRRPLWIPLHPALAASIPATPRTGLFLLESEYGRPYSAKGFGMRFSAWARAAGVEPGYSAHGLRKACGRRLADAGCTAHQIMAVLGHRSLAEAERYTATADQRRLARAAIDRLPGGTGTERESG